MCIKDKLITIHRQRQTKKDMTNGRHTGIQKGRHGQKHETINELIE